MKNNEFVNSQSSPQLNIDEYSENNQIIPMNETENSKDTKFLSSFSQDINSDKCIESIIKNDSNTSCDNKKQHKYLSFYHSEGKSEPNLVDCSLVPRSPSTTVQLDMNDLKNRDQDVICSDKFHFNDSSSNVSYMSNASIPMPNDKEKDKNTQENKEININEPSSDQTQPEKVQSLQKQSKQNNQSKQINQPQPGKKIPKIPDIFYHSKQNLNHGNNKNDKLAYSWPKKRKTNHLPSSSQNRHVAPVNRPISKK